jgi:putative alpha-1,2-mannosidase
MHVGPQFFPASRVSLNPAIDDDYAAYKLGVALGKPLNVTSFLLERAMRTPFTLFNADTGFMEARNQDGSWAAEDRGWTEGMFTFNCNCSRISLIHKIRR